MNDTMNGPTSGPTDGVVGRLAGVLEPSATQIEGAWGAVLAHAEPSPARGPGDACQDALAVIPVGQGLVLAVADGVGGARGGAEAAQLAIDALYGALANVADDDEAVLRGAILDAFERADAGAQATRTVGSTTLLVVEIQQGVLRTYNTGDSEALIVGGRGKLKLRTVAHSPVGYQVAAGVLDPSEALHHDMRHYITNVVGDGKMRIDVGPSYLLAAHDTLLMASDGLFDNVTLEEICTIASRGSMAEATQALLELARRRMRDPQPGDPSKPDDLSLVLYRPPARA